MLIASAVLHLASMSRWKAFAGARAVVRAAGRVHASCNWLACKVYVPHDGRGHAQLRLASRLVSINNVLRGPCLATSLRLAGMCLDPGARAPLCD